MTSIGPRTAPGQRAYPLRRSSDEQERLVRQGAEWADVAHQFLREAGLCPGMRVIDYGCGLGDFGFAAAEIVGDSGEVVGIDFDAGQIECARDRNRFSQLRFIEGDFSTVVEEGGFDAIIGRFVLMYQSDPAATLAVARSNLRAGGLCAFQEAVIAPELLSACAWPAPPDAVQNLLLACVSALGDAVAHPRLGLALPQVFAGAGFDLQRARFEVRAPVCLSADIKAGFAQSWSEIAQLAVRQGRLTAEDVAAAGLEAYARSLPEDASRMSAPLSVMGWARCRDED